jgi:hypothetical protein
MNLLAIILLVLALACFILATFNLVARVNLVACGLAFCVLAWLFGLLGVG